MADSSNTKPAPAASGLVLGKLSGKSDSDRAWSAATLYKNKSNPILQEFSLQGRLHLQTAYGVEGGDHDFSVSDYKTFKPENDETVWGNDIDVRRARIGFKSKWFQQWKLETNIDVDPNGHDDGSGHTTFYKNLQECVLTYDHSDAVNVSIGKTRVKFTREQEISSNEILTIERSLLANTLFPGELTGIWLDGKNLAEHWSYELGVFANDQKREFSDLDAGTIYLAKAGYDYSKAASLDSAEVGIQFMHNTEPGFQSLDTDSNYDFDASPSFGNSVALTNDISHGRFGLVTDIFHAGDGLVTATGKKKTPYERQSDVFGLTVIPSWNLTEQLQLVAKFHLATSAGPDGLRSPSRYERPAATDDKGNTYRSAYLGLNYYLYGHQLKLMNGIEYAEMGGGSFDGYTLMSALRFSF